MAEKKLGQISVTEYLELEGQSDVKNEYDNGAIVSMSGGTLNHGIIGNNINTCLNNAIRSKGMGCMAINGDVRIFITNANSFVYPDAMVICGPIETFEADENSVVNPVLIVEVLSKSTESYDRGDKFHKYCSLPSFREYILIDQYKPVIDVLYREKAGYWKMATYIGMEKSISLNTIHSEISLEDIYRNAQGLLQPQFRLEL
ncbi:MAG: Uma2 family endonuclease [Phaeodactylibacter sp.]|nr:Uma2 family endonuclease [Phaeodactylibacter sp.]MCB9275216.1 Uma2 family endonuclease [Lewinellaceae bacterium]